MSWTEAQRVTAVAELRDDPERRGYAEMTDEEVAADMALRICPQDKRKAEVRARDVVNILTVAELTAWRTSAVPNAVTTWEIFLSALAADGTIRGDWLTERMKELGPEDQRVVSADSVAKVAATLPTVSRAELLGLWDIKPGHVTEIRRGI